MEMTNISDRPQIEVTVVLVTAVWLRPLLHLLKTQSLMHIPTDMFLTVKNILCSAQTNEFICFVWISEQTAIISLHSINWLVFVTETECVYCAVRAECLYIIQGPLMPGGYYMYHRFNIHKFHVLPTQLYLCVLCGSQNKQRLFPYTALTDWFL